MLAAIQHALGTAVVGTCRWSGLNLEVFLLDMFVSSYADSWLLICKDFFFFSLLTTWLRARKYFGIKMNSTGFINP